MDVMDLEGCQQPSQTFQERISTIGIISEQILSSLIQKSDPSNSFNSLILLFKFSGLYSFKQSLSRYFTYFIILTMWLSIFIVFLNFFRYSSSKYFYHQIGNFIWMIHSATTYTIIAYDMIYLNGRILAFMNTISSEPSPEIQEFSQNVPRASFQKLKLLSWCLAIGVCVVVVVNVLFIIYLYLFFDGLYIFLHITKSLCFDVLGVGLWYFLTYGWVISLPIVCLPAYALHCRIRTFIDFIKIVNQTSHPSIRTLTLTVDSPLSSSKSPSILTLEKIMEWYDELYAANRLLIMNVSLLLTVDILLCSILSVFLLHVCLSLSLLTTSVIFLTLSSVFFSWGVASSCFLSCLCLADN
jgi:hypothetical protein